MQAVRKTFLIITLSTIFASSLQAQDPPFMTSEEYSEAYADSSRVTHWSVYIPVTVLVAAAIWLGFKDGSHHDGSVEGNGSLATGSRKSYGSYSH